MEYIDHCPNCGQILVIEENPANYVIKTTLGRVVGSHCPNCKCQLAVDSDGLYVVKRQDDSDLLEED